jgi:hypothetical protein
MMKKIIYLFCYSFFVTACATSFNTPNATGHYVASPVQCVPFARGASGVGIYGDAYTWWDQANPPHYSRGNQPIPGAVLVLARTNRMTHGHVAVVKTIINTREIAVTHSNWGNDWKTRRIIYDSVRVRDISPMNDWTLVKFFNHESNNFGFPYAARGFIYKGNVYAGY